MHVVVAVSHTGFVMSRSQHFLQIWLIVSQAGFEELDEKHDIQVEVAASQTGNVLSEV